MASPTMSLSLKMGAATRGEICLRPVLLRTPEKSEMGEVAKHLGVNLPGVLELDIVLPLKQLGPLLNWCPV